MGEDRLAPAPKMTKNPVKSPPMAVNIATMCAATFCVRIVYYVRTYYLLRTYVLFITYVRIIYHVRTYYYHVRT